MNRPARSFVNPPLDRRRLHGIVEQRGRRHVRACPGPAEEQVRHVAAVEANAVQGAAERGERLGRRQKRRADKCPDAGRVALGRDHRFDRAADRSRGRKIVGGHVADAADVERVFRQPSPTKERREEQQLVRGIETIEIARRIGLGVAERLRLRQRVVE